jgi:hypothetical protein
MRAMRIVRLLYIYLPVPAMAVLSSMLAADEVAAQVVPQCYIESIPCGTPEAMYRQVSECLQDPDLCRIPKSGAQSSMHSDNTAASPKPPTPAPSAPPRSAVAAAHRPVQLGLPPLRQLAAKSNASAVTTNAEPPVVDIQNRSVDELAADLPLDQGTRDLTDAMPPDPGAIELRLGLRRTRAIGVDMRGRTPSPVELVEALAPKERTAQ